MIYLHISDVGSSQNTTVSQGVVDFAVSVGASHDADATARTVTDSLQREDASLDSDGFHDADATARTVTDSLQQEDDVVLLPGT